jgi:hypothetical protein
MMVENRVVMGMAFVIALLVLAEADAGLRWGQRRVEPGVKPSATAVEAGFAFRNVGDSPVTITGVRTSCGCTAAALEQKFRRAGHGPAFPLAMRVPEPGWCCSSRRATPARLASSPR